jgi:hypothetical protein
MHDPRVAPGPVPMLADLTILSGMLRSGLALSLLAALAACRVEDAPQQPIADHVALCCKAEAGQPLTFTGCRPSNHCRTIETVWVRGFVECGPVEASRCEGGRCCSLDASSPREPASTEAPIEGEPIEAIGSSDSPAPAAIEPMPFEP